MDIEYINRATGRKEKEQIYGHKALSLLYGNSFISHLFAFLFLPLIAKVPFFSDLYGKLQKSRASAKKIAPFIETYNIDTSEFVEKKFSSFNEFFIRKLKSQARPIIADPKKASLPADGRYLAFQNLQDIHRFYVKGKPFDLPSFLQNKAYARRFHDGAMLIARLCPTDYHRFHFIADGIAGTPKQIQGDLYSVSPFALHKKLSILWENKRMITDIETDMFGKVLYIEIGATCVGTIHQTYTPEQKVRKGEEKGYFSFGGSCLVLLFEKDQILFDSDLVSNSKQGLETKACFGQSLGTACRNRK